MNIFGGIYDKIFGKKQAPQAAPKPATVPAAGQAQPVPQQPRPTAAPAAPAQPVDVEAVLTQMAAAKGGGGNWRTSIVDLLKMLDLDSSLAARKELAQELGVNAGDHGSAEQNIALSKAVWKKLAENGGKVPASLKD